MPREKQHGSNTEADISLTSDKCDLCTSKNQAVRHKHMLEYRGDLSIHLKESVPRGTSGTDSERDSVRDRSIERITGWASQMHEVYGNQVGEIGNILTTWESRQETWDLYRQKYYSQNPSPKLEKGKKVVIDTFRILLKSANSHHSTFWLELINDNFPKGVNEEDWGSFVKLMTEYYRSAKNPENAHKMGRLDAHETTKAIARKLAVVSKP